VAGLQEQGLLTENDWKRMDEEILQAIDEAVAFAKESPFPDLDTALEDMFAD
jgi:TPP-dependent pyruvate/acetoin dehydrogenase alpha subunit